MLYRTCTSLFLVALELSVFPFPSLFTFINIKSLFLKCIGQNFAYNEAGYFIVRLLQRFKHLELAPHAQPDGSSPPQSWKSKGGRQAIEKMWPSMAFTLYVKVVGLLALYFN